MRRLRGAGDLTASIVDAEMELGGGNEGRHIKCDTAPPLMGFTLDAFSFQTFCAAKAVLVREQPQH